MISDIQPNDRNKSLLKFKEAMGYLRVSRSTIYRFMEAGQLTGHKVGCTWRFYREDLQSCIGEAHQGIVSETRDKVSHDFREHCSRDEWAIAFVLHLWEESWLPSWLET
jgi:excisionase family DNA binding protein